ncbi:putative polyketide biosynthesis enoyl-CoA hydratase PksH [Streptomyces humidus]|uniref:Polyketide biosynthesis enoyl-CoA hydratase PksH n=1 Tax=Streptomyces humidus TaxID=52259 RepID=A0A918FWS0_9ACTN|nr:enoyl-CoA hydratase-related protein [Streptomyces humidus]GGR96770.1 putative polyketide biosynthesis enoyl-CoA hydratase PksH [Streptomyces humidus]
MSHGTVRVRHQDPAVVRITLSRPERGNTVDSALIADLHEALDGAEKSDTCRLVVLDSPGPVFCNGLDMAEAAGEFPAAPGRDAEPGRGASDGSAFFGLLRRLTEVPRLTLACVDGRVAGGGVGIAAACDLVHTTERGLFSLPEALWGLLPCSVLPFLIRRTGSRTAGVMTLTTLPLTAQEAVDRGLADELSPDAGPLTRRLLSRLTKVDVRMIGEAKAYLSALHPVTAETERRAVTEFARLAAEPGVREGMARFAAEGRYPWER